MRSRISIFPLTMLFGIGVFAQTPALKISHLTDSFFVYTTYNNFDGTPFPSNSMYLLTDSGVVLFDTPWDTAQFQPLLDSLQQKHGRKAVMCIATHSHADRTAGLAYFKARGIKTWSSFQTLQLCHKFHEKEAAFYFTSDTVFQVAQQRFEIFYPGAGHTPDNIVIWFPDAKILYGGCFIKSTESAGLGNIADADLRQWPKSLKRTQKKFADARYVIPGHMGWNNKNSIFHSIKLLKEHGKH